MQDFANPLVREFLEVYPDLSGKEVSEFWQAGKWIDESDLDDLSPMWANWKFAPHRHFYIKELAQFEDGQFVIPMRYGKIDSIEIVEFYGVRHYDAVSNFIDSELRSVLICIFHSVRAIYY